MNKVYKLLHKKLDRNVDKDKAFAKRKVAIEAVFKEDKLPLQNKDVFDFYRNEIIYHGINNKRKIEDAYFQGMVKMQDYFEHLDFKEKQRMMNYEIDECLKELIYFEKEDTKIYIPFFDEKMNRIYQNEMVLFDLKQYHRLVKDYVDIFQKDYYGLNAYHSNFSSLTVIGQFENKVTMYDAYTKRLFFLEDMTCIEYLTLSKDDHECLQDLSLSFFYDDMNKLIDTLESSENINMKLAKKLRKYSK